MMKSKNEKGYSLLVTLLTIILISSIFLMFSLGTFTQQKQVNLTDSTMTATNVAEMGVEYYRTTLLNELQDRKNALQERINNLPKEGLELTKIKEEDIKALEGYKNFIRNDLISEKEIIDDINTAKYELTSVKVYDDIASLKIKGIFNDIEDTIKVDFKIPLDLLLISGGSEEKDGDENLDDEQHTIVPIPDFSKINTYPLNLDECNKKFKDNTKCKNFHKNILKTNFNEIKGATVYFYSNVPFVLNTTQVKNFGNSNFYFNKGLTIDGNFDKNSNYSLYVNGDINFLKKFGKTSIGLFSPKSINFNNDFSISNLSLYAGEKATFNQSISLTDSGVNVNKLESGAIKLINSNMCVRNIIKIDQLDIDNKSHLYYIDGKQPSRIIGSSKNIKQVNKEDFIKFCSTTSTGNTNPLIIDYGDVYNEDSIIKDIDYNSS